MRMEEETCTGMGVRFVLVLDSNLPVSNQIEDKIRG